MTVQEITKDATCRFVTERLIEDVSKLKFDPTKLKKTQILTKLHNKK